MERHLQEQYAYDNSGERVVRRSTSNGTTTLTVYAFGLEEHVYDGSGNNQSNTYYYSLGGHLIGSFDGTNTQFFVTDALGSVLATFADVANNNTILGNQVYGPYGNQHYSSGTVGTNKGFTGQYADATGLDYYNARYYDPVIGRFMSADTVDGNGSGLDPYAYVNGNPETATDPTGHHYVGFDGSTVNTESDGNGGTRVTIHNANGSTRSSTDYPNDPDPIPGAPSPAPVYHPSPVSHHSGGPVTGRGQGPNPKLSREATGLSNKCNNDICGQHSKDRLISALSAQRTRVNAWVNFGTDAAAGIADIITAVLDLVTSQWVRLTVDVVSAVAHITAGVVEFMTATGQQIPAWLATVETIAHAVGQIADYVSAIADALAILTPNGAIGALAESFLKELKPIGNFTKAKAVLQLAAATLDVGSDIYIYESDSNWNQQQQNINNFSSQDAYNQCVMISTAAMCS